MRHAAIPAIPAILSIPFLTAASANAQSSLIVPAPARTVSTTVENSTTDVPFYGHTNTAGTYGRFQYFYDVNTIPPVVAAFKAIAWRQSATYGGRTLGASSGEYTITMDTVAAEHDKVSTTFANNHSTRKKLVFDGSISFPAGPTGGGTWPRPWQPTLPFNKGTFLYLRTDGKSLMVETEASTRVVNGNFPFPIEAYRSHDGRRATNEANANCRDSGGSKPTTATHDDSGLTSIFVPNLVPGGHWQMTVYPYPRNSGQFNPSFCVVGFTGKGGTYLGQTLPALFTAFGLNTTDNANCRLGNSLDLLLGASYNPTAGTVTGPKIPIPNNPIAVGVIFYAQMVSQDSGVLFPSFSHQLTINSGNPPGGTSVRTFFHDPTQPLPTLGSYGSQSQVPTFRLDY